MTDLRAEAAAELADLEARDQRRFLTVVESMPGPRVSISGSEYLLMCSNNYLGLATDPRLAEAAARAAYEWGVGSGASRLVSGSTSLHAELEARLAAFEGREDAVVFSSGYLTNLGVLAALARKGDTIVSDALNHASIVDGCRLSGAAVEIYPHADIEACEKLVRDSALGGGRTLVVSDTVFSMDGDRAPVAELGRICDEHGAILVVDDAHGTGVTQLTPEATIVIGTCSKSLGTAGGFAAASREVCDLLRNRVRSFIFNTAPPAPVVAATITALDIVESEPEHGRRVREHARSLAAGIRSFGFEVPEPDAAIVPVIVGESSDALALGTRIRERGIFAPPIRPPSVPEGTARIRLCPMATHTDADIGTVIEAFASG